MSLKNIVKVRFLMCRVLFGIMLINAPAFAQINENLFDDQRNKCFCLVHRETNDLKYSACSKFNPWYDPQKIYIQCYYDHKEKRVLVKDLGAFREIPDGTYPCTPCRKIPPFETQDDS